MPLSRREKALAAVEALLRTIPGVNHFRTPDRVLGADEMPFVSLVDGDDTTTPLTTDEVAVVTSFAVGLGIRQDNPDESESLGTRLNALYAQIRQAIGSDYTLGNTVEQVSWVGTTNPNLVADEGPPQVYMEVIYEISRLEPEFNPYAAD